MERSTSIKIYKNIIKDVHGLIEEVSKSESNEEITETQRQIHTNLMKISEKLSKELKNLEELSEWDTFSVAFYGETNAGKSTLIETLRILLNEPEKMKERKNYNNLLSSINGIQEKINDKKEDIDRTEYNYGQIITGFDQKIESINTNKMDIELNIGRLESDINEKLEAILTKKKGSFISLILSYFGWLTEQKEISTIKHEISNFEQTVADLTQEELIVNEQKNSVINEQNEKTAAIKQEIEELECNLLPIEENINKFTDGKIIGDGSSDYTREVITYNFESNGQKFALMDLPGIEPRFSATHNDIGGATPSAS